jgi:hypothetical protein
VVTGVSSPEATALHRRPRVVGRGGNPTVGRVAVFGRRIKLETPATSVLTSAEITCPSEGLYPAVASTPPDDFLPSVRGLVDNDESFKPLATQVEHLHMADNIK